MLFKKTTGKVEITEYNNDVIKVKGKGRKKGKSKSTDALYLIVSAYAALAIKAGIAEKDAKDIMAEALKSYYSKLDAKEIEGDTNNGRF